MSTGRNDPCPCGSGLKYKKCCLPKEEAAPENLLWHRLRAVLDGTPSAILKYAIAEHGRGIVDAAWREFSIPDDDDEEFDASEEEHTPLFMPWFFNLWIPDPLDGVVSAEDVARFPVALDYVRRGSHIDPLLARYVEVATESPISFYDVAAVRPGAGFTLRDIFTGQADDVTERGASRTVPEGNILVAQVVSLDGVSVLEGCAPLSFPAVERARVLELRGAMERNAGILTTAEIREYDLEIIQLYLEIGEELLDTSPDMLQNTDGDPLAFCRVTYEIPSPQAAFEALRPLAAGAAGSDRPADASLAPDGTLLGGTITWVRAGNDRHPSWPDTVLGLITIDGARLVAELDSETRAQQFREHADAVLPAGSRHVSTVVETAEGVIDQMLEESPAPAPG